MNDETEQFERRLNRQPLRPIPSEWREDILREGRRVVGPNQKSRPSLFLAFNLQPSTLFRWSALAAVWVVILALNHAARDTTPIVTAKSTPPSPQMLLALRQQQKLLAELIEPAATRDADKPKSFVPRPRSELGLPFLNA